MRHSDNAQPTIDVWNQAIKEHNVFIFEHRIKTAENIYERLSIRAIPILNVDNSVGEWVGIHAQKSIT